MHRFSYLSCLLLVGACVVDSPKDGGAETESTGPGASDSASDTGSPTEGAEGGATEGEGSASESASESGETDSGSTGEVVPAACVEADPSVSAAFELELVDWPDAISAQHEIDVGCVVESVADGPTITTTLQCDVGGEQRVAILKFAAPVLDEDYVAGEPVQLISRASDLDEIGLGVFQHVEMRSAADGRLLVVAVRDEVLAAEWFAPLAVEVTLPCGPEQGFDAFDPLPMQINFEIPEGPELGLIHGHSGLLDGGAGFAFDIDVEDATTDNCCHNIRFHHVLLRRVVVDG